RLLGFELCVRQDALVLQGGQILQLLNAVLRGRGRRGGRLLLFVGSFILSGPAVCLATADAIGNGRRRPGDHGGASPTSKERHFVSFLSRRRLGGVQSVDQVLGRAAPGGEGRAAVSAARNRATP